MSLMKLQTIILLKLNPPRHVPLTHCVASRKDAQSSFAVGGCFQAKRCAMELCAFPQGTPFSPQRTTGRQTVVIQT